MCTLSWFFTEDGYELFSNRDERRTRLPATAPSVAEAQGVRYLSPSDSEAGGTWIAVNELGLSLSLLNLYQATRPAGSPQPPRSRGLLVRDLAGSDGLRDVATALERADLERYEPFTLLAVEPGLARAFEWDGRSLVPLGEPDHPLVSSAVVFSEAAAARRRSFEALGAEGLSRSPLHLAFHSSHLPERGRLSACMHREDAKTVGFTQVTVSAGEVALAYAPGSPCRVALGTPVRLERRLVALPA
ncbi:MAG TPA: NRDE family protein [Thermoanaerobaculia bacterium]|nr:NRDE family protein [Thermoanaerobaculia bacterium]